MSDQQGFPSPDSNSHHSVQERFKYLVRIPSCTLHICLPYHVPCQQTVCRANIIIRCHNYSCRQTTTTSRGLNIYSDDDDQAATTATPSKTGRPKLIINTPCLKPRFMRACSGVEIHRSCFCARRYCPPQHQQQQQPQPQRVTEGL